jgi:hypothetical protein
MRFAEARYCFRIPAGKLVMRRNMFYFVLARNALLLLAIMPAALAVAAPLQQPQARVPLEGILNSNITACAFAKTNTNFNWRYGTIFNPNPRCWLYGVQFSGWAQATPPSQQERNVVLLTSRHGLTCAHAFGSPPGTLVVMLGTNGVKYTNAIASTIGGLSDLLLVVFTNDWPAAVTPWRVLSPGDVSVLNLSRLHAIWYRNNTQKMNACERTFSLGESGYIRDPIPGIPFFEPTATGGDSGSPVFLLHENRPILLWLVHTADLGGPFVSNPKCFAWLSNNVAPYRPTTASLQPPEPSSHQ